MHSSSRIPPLIFLAVVLTVLATAVCAFPYVRYVPMDQFEEMTPDVHTYTINRLLAEKVSPHELRIPEISYVPVSAKRSGFLNLNLNNDIGRFLQFIHPGSPGKTRRSQ
ncbi:hypothetical protein L596_014379 [Steinernema carpocapsae]|uniref:Uncharacterized protein n=1 Tax=Steinernema carpocapsae TaxID=34508 RepID=A0A4U5NCJ7_STECR|nr:hypothetical protein L596_014379 [Steinernema carpocapsae]